MGALVSELPQTTHNNEPSELDSPHFVHILTANLQPYHSLQ